jgi:hypothetical protein
MRKASLVIRPSHLVPFALGAIFIGIGCTPDAASLGGLDAGVRSPGERDSGPVEDDPPVREADAGRTGRGDDDDDDDDDNDKRDAGAPAAEACFEQCVASNAEAKRYLQCAQKCGEKDMECNETCFQESCGSSADACDQKLDECAQKCFGDEQGQGAPEQGESGGDFGGG